MRKRRETNMARQQYPANANYQFCALCRKWQGNRSVSAYGDVTFDSDDKGKCMGGTYHNSDTQATSTCSSFEKQFTQF